jgi:integrase/recombinase XerD
LRRDHVKALASFESDYKLRNLAPNSFNTLLSPIRIFLSGVRKRVRNVTTEDVRRHLAARSKVLSPVSQMAELSRLRSFFQALLRAELVERDPTEGLRVDEAKSPPQLLLAEASVARMFAICGSPFRYQTPFFEALALRDRACLELIYGLALRTSEARAARVVDLHVKEGTLLVRRAKRGKAQVLPIPKASIPWLERYLAEARPRLLRDDGRDKGHYLVSFTGHPLDKWCLGQIVERIAFRAGVKKAHPHAFRRAIATHLVRAGAKLTSVSAFLGHQALATTAIYVEVDREDLRRAVDTLDLKAK